MSSDDLSIQLAALFQLAQDIPELKRQVASLQTEVELLRQGDPEAVLGTEAAATLLGTTPGALRQAATRGSIPCDRRGRKLEFKRGLLLRRKNSRGKI